LELIIHFLGLEIYYSCSAYIILEFLSTFPSFSSWCSIIPRLISCLGIISCRGVPQQHFLWNPSCCWIIIFILLLPEE
jgi:hypothetical protein